MCVHVCVFFRFISVLMHCQDVSSFGNAPVKMCRLWAEALCVCACVCVLSFYFCPKCTCQDVLCFGNAPVKICCLWARGLVCVCMCVCVLSLYFCPKCIVKMCRVSAMHLLRCVICGQRPCVFVHVCVFFLFISALNALSCFVK